MFAKILELGAPYLDKMPILFTTQGALFAMFISLYFSKALHVLCSVLLLAKYDNVQASFRYTESGQKNGFALRTVQRAYNAHINQWEAFAGFSAAVLLVLQADQNTLEVTRLANAFIFVRLIYNFVYIFAFNTALSTIRSAVWLVGLAILVRIFTIGAGELNLF